MTPAHLTTLRAHAVPGDLWPDVLAGWTGPAEIADDTRALGRRWIPSCIGWSHYSPPHRTRLPLDRREVRAHVAHLMATGLRCPRCFGSGAEPETNGERNCSTCINGTGYLRPPRPAWHLLPPGESATPLPPELAAHAPALLACHVASVAAGGVGVRGVLEWVHVPVAGSVGDYQRWELRYVGEARAVDIAIVGPCCGDERPKKWQPWSDSGFALVTGDGIALPWPTAAEVDRG